MLTRVKGTRDLLDLSVSNFLINKIKEHFATYNFKEISPPILEKFELFHRTVGSQTDIVSKEMYFVEPAGDERIVLRPEITASIMRAFLNNNISNLPWKVFAHGSVFRHERPQKGRYREFGQVSIETIGIDSPSYDAYFLAMMDRFFGKMGLKDYVLDLNFLGCKEDLSVYKGELISFLNENEGEICENCRVRKEKNVLRVLDCKNENCAKIYSNVPKITDHLCKNCETEWGMIQKFLEELSVSYSHQPMLVRGFDYYSKIVFEFLDESLGAQSAFCGGGRYNEIARQLGAKQDYPSIGAGIGFDRLVILLEQIKSELPIAQESELCVILPFSYEQVSLALLLTDELNSNGICAEPILDKFSLKSGLRKANSAGAKFVLLLGPDEQKEGYVTVKNLVTGDEERVAQAEMPDFFGK